MTRVELEWIVPLYWADPPGSLLREIYEDSRAAVPYRGGTPSLDSTVSKQGYLRKVSAEYGRRLALAMIYVEGETDVVEQDVDSDARAVAST